MDKLKPEDSEQYVSTVSRIPFKVETKALNRKGEVIRIHTVESVIRREKQLNYLIERLESLDWMQYITVSSLTFNSRNKNDSHSFSFNLKPEFNANFFQPTLQTASLFNFNLFKARITLNREFQTSLVEEFYYNKYNEPQAEKTITSYRKNQAQGISIQDLIEILEYSYKTTAKQLESLVPNIPLTKELYLKLYATRSISNNIGYSYKRMLNNLKSFNHPHALVDFTLGEEASWLPYLHSGVTVENLAYLFSHTMQLNNNSHKASQIDDYIESIESQAPYTVEQVKEAGALPFVWFKELFPNPYYKA
jgi:hypothetical protein